MQSTTTDPPPSCGQCGASLTDRDAPTCEECDVGDGSGHREHRDNWPEDLELGNPVG
jgi:hypothetical protein